MATGKVIFNNRVKKAKQTVDIADILGANNPDMISIVAFHALLCGCYFAVGTNRARTAVKLYAKLDGQVFEEWANSVTEMQDKLAELNEALVNYGKENGRIQSASKA